MRLEKLSSYCFIWSENDFSVGLESKIIMLTNNTLQTSGKKCPIYQINYQYNLQHVALIMIY